MGQSTNGFDRQPRFSQTRARALAALLLAGRAALAYGQSPIAVLSHGPDSNHLVVAVLGDGYDSVHQQVFASDVDRLLVKELLTHDLYGSHAGVFNVYRLDLVSIDQGVRTPKKPKLNTALHTIYTGSWKRCWIEPSPDTDVLVARALVKMPKVDLTLVLLNQEGPGGCATGTTLMMTRTESWQTAAHEYGHGIGDLYDEYAPTGHTRYPGPSLNRQNCSSLLDSATVSWKGQLDAGVIIPPATNPAAATKVGMFEECDLYNTSIYRPSLNCRMRALDREFCAVCSSLMQASLAKYQTGAPPRPAPPVSTPGAEGGASYARLLLQIDRKTGAIEVLDATEFVGAPPERPTIRGNYVFEILDGDSPIVAGTMPDPFAKRSYGPPDSNPHADLRTDRATVTVEVPNLRLETLKRRSLGMTVYRSIAQLEVSPVDLAAVKKLKAANGLAKVASISAAKFTGTLKQKLSH